jgi:2,4-dienoyl-CoA reductase-like NADH-dependent reductase (Old Yellow Enzyme family)
VATDISGLDVLFSQHRVGPRLVRNRFVAQAMEASDAAADGGVSERALARYLRLARGRWGMVFVEATSVTPTSLARLDGLQLNESTLPSFTNLVARFKEINPDGLLLIQLTHSGGLSHPQTDRTTSTPGREGVLRPLSGHEIERIRQQFIAAAHLAAEAGFDGIDFKVCHGYLGTELLRPANTRDDQWGGSFTNRSRFWRTAIEEIQRGLLRSWPDFILGSRMTFHERVPGGCGTAGPASTAYDPNESLALVQQMSELELDYVNVSGDAAEIAETESVEPEERQVGSLLFERLAHTLVRDLAENGTAAIAVIGTGYSELRADALRIAARRVVAGLTDLVGFGRQSFADPLLPAKVQEGKSIDYCVGCNRCVKLMLSGKLSNCVVYDER